MIPKEPRRFDLGIVTKDRVPTQEEVVCTYRLCTLPQEERHLLGIYTGLVKPKLGEPLPSPDEIPKIVADAQAFTLDKLQTIGIESLVEYETVYQALNDGNKEVLTYYITLTQQRLSQAESHLPTHHKHTLHIGRRLQYKPTRWFHHRSIVREILKDVAPHNADQPTLVLLGGPQGVGKSAVRDFYQSQHTGSFALTDPDRIRDKLLDEYDDSNHHHELATREEAFHVSDKIMHAAMKQKRNIIAEGTWRNVDWCTWLIQKAVTKGYKVELGFVYAPLAECFRRGIAERDRPVDLPSLLSTMEGYNTLATLSEFIETGQLSTPIELTVFQSPMNKQTKAQPLLRQSNEKGKTVLDKKGYEAMYHTAQGLASFAKDGKIRRI